MSEQEVVKPKRTVNRGAWLIAYKNQDGELHFAEKVSKANAKEFVEALTTQGSEIVGLWKGVQRVQTKQTLSF